MVVVESSTLHAPAGQPYPTAPLEACPIDDPGWIGFVGAHDDATPFHHPAWASMIARCYGFRALAAVQRDAASRIVAGIPLVEIQGPRATSLVALPFTDACEPLLSGAAARPAFAAALRVFAHAAGASLQVHADLPGMAGLQAQPAGVRHLLGLDGGEPAIARRLRGTPVQRAIRKAQRAGVAVRLTRSHDDLDAFYRLHWQTRRRLGIPVQPRRFIDAVFRDLLGAGLGFVALASMEGRPIAAALFLTYNRTIVYKYGASDARYWDLRPNNLVMWSAIEWACLKGYRVLDFGRSDLEDRGLRDFKSRWGATEIPLTYTTARHGTIAWAGATAVRLARPVIRRGPAFICRGLGELFYRRAATGAP